MYNNYYSAFSNGVSCFAGPNAVTSRGNDFYIGFPGNNPLGSVVTLTLFVTTNEPNPVDFTVRYLDVTVREKVEYGSSTAITLPSSLQVTATSNAELGKGVRVTTDNQNEQVSVFGLNSESVSTDGFLALPSHAYAANMITVFSYFIFSADSPIFLSQFLIVPTQDDTTITLFPTQTINFPSGFGPTSLLQIRRGFSGVLTGQAGQTILIKNPDDLTGTIIESNKPLSVFTGHECGLVPVPLTACDHLVEQIPPHVTWGKTFFTAPLGLRQSGERYRVGSIYNGNEVRVTCTQQGSGERTSSMATIGRGEYYEFVTQGNPLVGSPPSPTIPRDQYRPQSCCIQTSGIATVMAYSQSHSLDEIDGPGGAQGDPFMMLISPATQYLNNYTVPTAGSIPPFDNSYISSLVPVEFFDSSNVLVDNAEFSPENGYTAIYCSQEGDNICAYSGFSIFPTKADDHTVVNTGGDLFSIQAFTYGFRREISYGFPTGMELEPLGRKFGVLLPCNNHCVVIIIPLPPSTQGVLL